MQRTERRHAIVHALVRVHATGMTFSYSLGAFLCSKAGVPWRGRWVVGVCPYLYVRRRTEWQHPSSCLVWGGGERDTSQRDMPEGRM